MGVQWENRICRGGVPAGAGVHRSQGSPLPGMIPSGHAYSLVWGTLFVASNYLVLSTTVFNVFLFFDAVVTLSGIYSFFHCPSLSKMEFVARARKLCTCARVTVKDVRFINCHTQYFPSSPTGKQFMFQFEQILFCCDHLVFQYGHTHPV